MVRLKPVYSYGDTLVAGSLFDGGVLTQWRRVPPSEQPQYHAKCTLKLRAFPYRFTDQLIAKIAYARSATGDLLLKVCIYSDLHCEMDARPSLLPQRTSDDVDLVILGGDIHTKGRGVKWAQAAFDTPVAYVCGDHEFYLGHIDKTLRSMKEQAEGSQVHVLENEVLIVGDVRILGATAWTDFSAHGNVYQSSQEAKRCMNDFRKIRTGEGYRALAVSDVISRNHETYQWLARELAQEFEGKTIVVTHHCPLAQFSGPEQGSALMPAYSNQWPELVSQADVWAFGHTHSKVDEIFEGCRIISNPRGYPSEECGFDAAFVIEV